MNDGHKMAETYLSEGGQEDQSGASWAEGGTVPFAQEEREQLLVKLAAAEQLAQDNRNGWMVTQAELENVKRRAEREMISARKYALEKFAQEILLTVDNLERSLAVKLEDSAVLQDFYSGIELTLKSLLETLRKFGITPIDPHGEPFNHEVHTAITMREEQEVPSNQILEVIQKGYRLEDRLLRPALVVVAK